MLVAFCQATVPIAPPAKLKLVQGGKGVNTGGLVFEFMRYEIITSPTVPGVTELNEFVVPTPFEKPCVKLDTSKLPVRIELTAETISTSAAVVLGVAGVDATTWIACEAACAPIIGSEFAGSGAILVCGIADA